MLLVLFLIGYVVGFILGYMTAKKKYFKEPIGTLRIDHSDPDDGPYLFLELSSDPGSIKHGETVAMKADCRSYISQ